MKTRINITIDPEVVEELDRQAKAEGRSRSGMVERLVWNAQAGRGLAETVRKAGERVPVTVEAEAEVATNVGPKQEVVAPASRPKAEPVTEPWDESP